MISVRTVALISRASYRRMIDRQSFWIRRHGCTAQRLRFPPDEVQGGRSDPATLRHLGERMYRYFYRIVDRYLEAHHAAQAESLSWCILTAGTGRPPEGEATLLQRRLTRKFGILPATLQQRVQTATPAQLETWSLNILDAATPDDAFTD